ncbi:hypothetical protein ABEB36_007424 [Hypothenemus hampei]|uniref:Uncharacterized protein n=1 Tax=Hypothenemus hampei TaxID=57062 RepID=A0ABD1ETZ6_HYPHA
MSRIRCFLVFILLILSITAIESATKFYEKDITSDGYYFRYKTDDGTERREQGKFKTSETGESPKLEVSGSYEYEVDGVITVVTYVADERGYRPIIQLKKKVDNQLPIGFTLDNRIDPKLLGSLSGGGLG